MTLPLTPEVLAAAYDYLAVTEPFRRWNLPESEEVKFRVIKQPGYFGWYQRDGKAHVISISAAQIAYSSTLLRTMAHEMIHLHLEITGMESRGKETVHNAAFRRFAARVTKYHGFDPKEFY